VLSFLEHSSVLDIRSGNESYLEDGSLRVDELISSFWHDIVHMIEANIHIVVEEFKDIFSRNKGHRIVILDDLLPNLLLFPHS